jgi:coenzyme PQQ synthesis protein D (PqqD)
MTREATRYRTSDGVLHAKIDEEEVLLNPDTGVYHLVNGTGRWLLDRMDEGQTLGEAIRSLSDAAGEDLQRVSAEAISFVEDMEARGLLEQATD